MLDQPNTDFCGVAEPCIDKVGLVLKDKGLTPVQVVTADDSLSYAGLPASDDLHVLSGPVLGTRFAPDNEGAIEGWI